MKAFRAYRMTPPSGAAFDVALIEDEDKKVKVLSNKHGDWAPEIVLKLEDIMQPEQNLNEWDVEKIDPPEIPDDDEDD